MVGQGYLKPASTIMNAGIVLLISGLKRRKKESRPREVSEYPEKSRLKPHRVLERL
jgi:hypothetical protein